MGLLGRAVGNVRAAPKERSVGGSDDARGGGANWVGRGGGVGCGRELTATRIGGVAGCDVCGRRGEAVGRGRRAVVAGAVCCVRNRDGRDGVVVVGWSGDVGSGWVRVVRGCCSGRAGRGSGVTADDANSGGGWWRLAFVVWLCRHLRRRSECGAETNCGAAGTDVGSGPGGGSRCERKHGRVGQRTGQHRDDQGVT